MADADIPVDLFNPGQVFACLGFVEAAEILLGDAEGAFDWSNEADVRFHLRAAGDKNPVEAVLEFLVSAELTRFGPTGYVDPPPKKGNRKSEDEDDEEETEAAARGSIQLADVFSAPSGDRMTLPIRLGGGNQPVVELGHWADGSSRDSFKLYSGNRSADGIARAMLQGVRKKPSNNQKKTGQLGDIRSKGIIQLWDENRDMLINNPFHVLTPMGGSFNFDPRGAWTALDAGYSPNEHKHPVVASPVVEFVAAWGMEHARPKVLNDRRVRYAVWAALLPPSLCRIALSGGLPSLRMRHFEFTLDLSGKNKIVTFAEEEMPG